MECTQRLECSQELYGAESEAVRIPEQIGFLGICGEKYPVKRGPNKIGRDREMCSIALALDSVSRTHAVINVLNGKEYMLMDLDSANKTKLNGKTLQPFIPYPMKNGDTVQFGNVFGFFGLLEDESDLPMTQAIDIPDTPIVKHTSKINKCGVTTVPESPDVSDRDDSFIMPSQPKAKQQFKSSSNKFMKHSGKTITIQPIGSHQIDNIYWTSSKKSLSLNDSDNNDDSMIIGNNTTHQNDDIHEMETQPPFLDKMVAEKDSIYTADTQLPNVSSGSIYSANTQHPNNISDSIHSVATQLPDQITSPSIHSLDTQMPEHLPMVKKICDQQDLQFDLYTANKENISIHNAETQMFRGSKSPILEIPMANEEDIFNAPTQHPFDKRNLPDLENDVKILEANTQFIAEKRGSGESTNDKEIQSKTDKITKRNKTNQNTAAIPALDEKCSTASKEKLNITSDEEILFDEVDEESFEKDFYSQPLIPSGDFELQDGEPEIPLSQTKLRRHEEVVKCKGNELVEAKESNEDISILPTQKIAPLSANEDDLTDCEDDNSEIEINNRKDCASLSAIKPDSPDIPFEELATQVLEEDKTVANYFVDGEVQNENPNIPFDEMATQVLEEDQILLQVINTNAATDAQASKLNDVITLNDDISENATQVLEEKNVSVEELPTQVLSENVSERLNVDVTDNVSERLNDDVTDNLLSPFKIPVVTPLKNKKRDYQKMVDFKTAGLSPIVSNVAVQSQKIPSPVVVDDDDADYYNATQDILDDLSSQQIETDNLISPFKIPLVTPLKNKKRDYQKMVDFKTAGLTPIVSNVAVQSQKIPSPVVVDDDDANYYNATQDILDELSSQQIESSPEIVKISTKTDNNQNKLPTKSQIPRIDADETVLKIVRCDSNLNDNQVAPLIKAGSDPAEEVTPKKVCPLKLMHTELPDSQEIKTNVTLATRFTANTESSSDSEVEQNSEEMTPILFRKKQKKKVSPLSAKIDLIKKFEATTNALPKRIITRVRKPTAKMQDSDVLKPKYLTEQDDDVDKEIITENITRWKSKNDKKSKTISDENTNANKSEDVVKAETKTEKISDKVVKKEKSSPKKKNTIKSQKSKRKTEDDLDKISLESKNKKSKEESSAESATRNVTLEITDRKINKPKHIAKEDLKTDKITNEVVKEEKTLTKKKTTSRSQKSKPKDEPIEIPQESKNTKTKEKSMTKNAIKEIINVENKTRSTRSCRRKCSQDEGNMSLPATTTVSSERGRRRQANKSKTNETTYCTDDITINDLESKQKIKDDKKATKETSKTKEKDKKESKTKTRSTTKKSEKHAIDETDSQTSIRRSKRQKTASQNETIDKYLVDMNTTVPRSKKIVTLEEQDLSTVYSISSESDDTPMALKRTASAHMEAPSSKRTRSYSRGRTTPTTRSRTQHVLFTAFNNDDVKKRLVDLGAVIVTDVKTCTVVVTLSLKRTFKLLCAVGLGIPIVGAEWVQACSDTNTIVDPWQYIINDEASERRFNFHLRYTLAGKRGFLRGLNVYSTPNVMPNAPEMKLIVECSGGTWKASGPKWICVSCLADKALWPDLEAKGAIIVSSEFILSGVLRQIADVETNRLH